MPAEKQEKQTPVPQDVKHQRPLPEEEFKNEADYIKALQLSEFENPPLPIKAKPAPSEPKPVSPKAELSQTSQVLMSLDFKP